MASLSIPYSDFVPAAAIVSQQFDDNNAAIVNYINARNSGSTFWDAVKSTGTITASGAITATGIVTANGQLIGKGTATNDDAAAGYIGEVISSSITSYSNAASTGTYGNITSISLTAGHWTIAGQVQTNLNGATITRSQMAISVNSGNTTTDHVSGVNDNDIALPTATSNVGGVTIYTLKLSGSSTVYLKGKAAFTGGPPQYLGSIYATRAR